MASRLTEKSEKNLKQNKLPPENERKDEFFNVNPMIVELEEDLQSDNEDDYFIDDEIQNLIDNHLHRKRTCAYCSTTFETETELQKHLYESEKLYNCHHCDYLKKVTKKELIIHCEQNGINYKTRYFFRKAMSNRLRILNPNERHRCEICLTEFTIKKDLYKHYEESHKNHYKCEVCNEGFSRVLEYIFHTQTHSDDNLYRCVLCSFSTKNRYKISSHLNAVHDQFKKHVCNICGKGFQIYPHLVEHKNFHTGEKPFQCDICGNKFVYSRYLVSHIAHAHKERSEDELKCAECGEMCETMKALIDHRVSKHPKQFFVCEFCGKSFKTNYSLKLHTNIHLNEKQHKCSYCEKKFNNKNTMLQHQLIHTGKKPYLCPHCGKGFTQRSSMVIHIRRHTGERPYVCLLCNKGFASRNILTNHRKSCKGAPHPSEDQ